MPIVLAESFDHHDAAAFVLKGWSRGPVYTTGRLSGSAFAFNSRTSTKALPGNIQTLCVGVAYKYLAVNDSPQIVGFLDAGTIQCDVRYDVPSSTFSITRNGTSLGTFHRVLTIGVWYYLEFKVTIDNSAGTADLWIDGVNVISLTSQDTQATANAYANEFKIGRDAGSDISGHLDDLVVIDCSGSAPTNDRLGDVVVPALFPDGNGNYSQLVGSDSNSTDNYLLVDETPPNGDSDYVESSTVGDMDTYTYQDLTPTSGDVYAVQVCMYARKTDAGTRKIASVARLSGTDDVSSDQILSASYQYLTDLREAKPGGGAWSISNVNSAEFGVKVTA